MLGRLFNSAGSTGTSPSGTRPSTSHTFESDELHTRGLLYPDALSVASSFHSSYSFSNGSLSQSSVSSAASSDCFDFESARDVRVIIAQDGGASESKVVLYDSKPATTLGCPGGASLEEAPTSPSLGGGTYGRARRRVPQYTTPEDELQVYTECMFGSGTLAYKGPSTKFHVLPPGSDERRSQSTAASPMASRRGSLRGGVHAQSTPQQAHPSTREKRKTVLITRLFSVVMPPTPTAATHEGGRNILPRSGDQTPTPTSSVGSNHGFPFPKMVSQNAPASAAKTVKPPKTAMYAIGLIISVPSITHSASCTSLATSMRCGYHRPMANYDMDGIQRHESRCPTPPSYDEEFPPLANSYKLVPGVDELYAANDGRIDMITGHWDLIVRALSDLQRIAQARILEGLTTASITAPPTTQNGFKYRKRVELRKMALMRDEALRGEVERLRWRVVTGIKVPRVVVGQGRWDVWKDEAKWANLRFGGRDANFFFFILLTAFLGHHLSWLDVLGPEPHKRRHLRQCRARAGPEERAMPIRTVLVSSDRIAARRLIYLLSAFLPAKPHQSLDQPQPISRTSSINYLSQSPPNFVVGGKVGSLKQRAKKKPSKLNMVSNETDVQEEAAVGWDISQEALPKSGSSSVAGSVLQLPLQARAMKKSGSTGTLTTLPSQATVTNAPASPQKIVARPGSSDSSASLNLMSTLKRTGTAHTSADSNDSRWGSFLSFWSNPKSCSSTGTSEPDEHATAIRKHGLKGCGLDYDESLGVGVLGLEDDQPNAHQPIEPFSPTLPEAPLRCYFDEADGAINVDVPLGLSVASLGSPLSSPPSSWAGAHPYDHTTPQSIPFAPPVPNTNPYDGDGVCKVVGWVDDERFHPDFLLQAVRPYAELESDIKRAMRMEPTPTVTGSTPWSESGQGNAGGEKWITVSEVLVADALKLQVKRLRLRRRTKAAPLQTSIHQSQLGRPVQPSITAEEPEEEILDEELFCDCDDTLSTAIEQLIGVVPPPSGTTPEMEGGCRGAVLGALEKIIGGVMKNERAETWGRNVLTEGVARWLAEIEEVA